VPGPSGLICGPPLALPCNQRKRNVRDLTVPWPLVTSTRGRADRPATSRSSRPRGDLGGPDRGLRRVRPAAVQLPAVFTTGGGSGPRRRRAAGSATDQGPGQLDAPGATSTTGLVRLPSPRRRERRLGAVEQARVTRSARRCPTVWKAALTRTSRTRGVWSDLFSSPRRDPAGAASATQWTPRRSATPRRWENGPRALRATAMRTQPGREILGRAEHVGAVQVFADAGLARGFSARRAPAQVMRVDFNLTVRRTSKTFRDGFLRR